MSGPSGPAVTSFWLLAKHCLDGKPFKVVPSSAACRSSTRCSSGTRSDGSKTRPCSSRRRSFAGLVGAVKPSYVAEVFEEAAQGPVELNVVHAGLYTDGVDFSSVPRRARRSPSRSQCS